MQQKTFIDISNQKINPQDAIDFITSPKHGAVDLFLGVVRDCNLNKEVHSITYEIFKPLTLQILTEICSKARLKYGKQLNIYLVHFNGQLTVGDISVAIAVSSTHRAEAFGACRFILEELKHTAPIWKQEHYRDGDSDWVKGHSLCVAHTKDTSVDKAVVLLGGKSSRMGQNKALLKLNGEFLINKTINTLMQLQPPSIILSGTLDGYATVPDLIKDCGPMGGICTVLLQEEPVTHAKVWLFIPVDMPLLTPKTLLKLLNTINGYDAACFTHSVFPLVLTNSTQVNNSINKIKQQLEHGEQVSVKSFLAMLTVNFVEAKQDINHELKNINTPKEWIELCGS